MLMRFGSRLGPGDDLLDGLPMRVESRLTEPPEESGNPRLEDRVGRVQVLDNPERQRTVKRIECRTEPRHNQLKMIVNLVAKGDVLGDQVAAMAGQELDVGVEGVGFVLKESEAVDRRAMD